MNDIMNGFLCAGPWFDGKLPDDFATIKLCVYSTVSIITIYFDFDPGLGQWRPGLSHGCAGDPYFFGHAEYEPIWLCLRRGGYFRDDLGLYFFYYEKIIGQGKTSMKKTNRYVLWGMTQSTLIHIFLMSIALTCLFPIFWMMRCAFMTNQTVFVDKGFVPHHLNFGNFAIAWTKGNFAVYFLNSVIYTVCVVTGIVFISSLAAFAFSRLKLIR